MLEEEKFNEEDIKIKVVQPYIDSLGFTLDEIKFEKTFKIKLGTLTHDISSGEQSEIARGRLDILCRRDNINLFIIEVKSPNKSITPADIDQGISYARLVHPIAPFLLVTNGENTKVIDVITKNELKNKNIGAESKYWQDGLELSVDEDLDLRYEALKNFIGYSLNNMKLFSRSQYEDRMQRLKGDISQLDKKKYIPELFLPRKKLIDEFDNHMKSSSKCFALIGESGVGKTNYICNLVEYFSEKHIVFFFNSANLVKPIIETMKEDFDWFFSSQLEAIEILRRIKALTDNDKVKGKVCFFFDAIDEAPSRNFNLDVEDFLSKLKRFPNIKVCVSCKSSEWHRFLSIKDTPSYLSEVLYKVEKDEAIFQKKNRHTKQLRTDNILGYRVERFSDYEIRELDKRYKTFFKYKGQISGDLKSECKLGFMLRVLAEVYRGEPLPVSVSTCEVLDKYLKMKLDKMDDPEIAKNSLRAIGKALIESEKSHDDSRSGYVEESKLRERLGLSISEKIHPELFSYNLLSRVYLHDGREFIGFYYTKIRDYIITIHSLGLPSLNEKDFRELIPDLFNGIVGQSTINWYSTIAKPEHHKILLEYTQTRALLFLNEYESILEHNFPNLKESFLPYTSGKIGIAMVDIRNRFFGSYGFFPLTNGNQNIIEVIRPSSDIELTKEMIRRGVKIYTIEGPSFFNKDPKDAAKKEIKRQLEKIIEEGLLNEDNNFGILLEKIIAILNNYRKELELKPQDNNYYSPWTYEFLPSTCDEILERIKIFYAKRYFREKKARELKINDYAKLDNYEIEREAKKAIAENIYIPEPDIAGSFPPFKVLKKSILRYKERKTRIDKPLLPHPDILEKDKIMGRIEQTGSDGRSIADRLIVQYSDGQLKKYIQSFFFTFIKEYKILVETCFHKFKEQLPFYSSLPIYFYFEAETQIQHSWPLIYCYRKSASEKTVVDGEINPLNSKIRLDSNDLICSTSFGALFYSRTSFKLDPGLASSRADYYCVIRNMVLQKIRDEAKYILDF
jgi:hypothetical protein